MGDIKAAREKPSRFFHWSIGKRERKNIKEERVRRKNSSGPEETIKGKTCKTYKTLKFCAVGSNEKKIKLNLRARATLFYGEVPSGTKYTTEGLFKERHTHDTFGIEIL